MMREIVLYTETVGGKVKDGGRAVDIGLVEMFDNQRTGRTWQASITPDVQNSEGGDLFRDVADDMLDFIDGATCLTHSINFDRDVFINEFYQSDLPLPDLIFINTLRMCKHYYFNSPKADLETLVNTLNLTVPKGKFHGALLGADIVGMVMEEINFDDDMFPNGSKDSYQIITAPSFLRGTVHDQRTPLFGRNTWTLKQRPEADVSLLNEVVLDNIARINATTGKVGPKTTKLLGGCGTDGFSFLNIDEALSLAQKTHSKKSVDAAFKKAGIEKNAHGLRWMCRGVLPDRWAACSLSISERKTNGYLNEGVKESIARINATTGPVSAEIACLMRSGGPDSFSKLSWQDALNKAIEMFSEEAVLTALEVTGSNKFRSMDTGWMCRGLRPDRWAACENAPKLTAREGKAIRDAFLANDGPGDEATHEVEDTPEMGM